MLFLFSPRGMGIAPIIKLSVVSRTSVLLLFLPRLHGFGTNESQIPYYFDHCLAVQVNQISRIECIILREGLQCLIPRGQTAHAMLGMPYEDRVRVRHHT